MKIPFSKPTLGREEEKAVIKVLRSNWLAAGSKTEEFEKKFADYVGVKYAIFTNSCTSALKMAFKYLKEEEYYKSYICPENTFCATYAAAEEIGLKRMSGGYRSVIVAVHYGGILDPVYSETCDIEDSAHRIEKNDPLMGKIRCYSFYATKNMTSIQGGMLVTDERKIYNKCRLYWRDGLSSSTADRLKGKSWKYEVKAMAGGYDCNDVCAAVGLEQLKKLPEFTKRRNEIRDKYNKAFDTDWKGNHLYIYFVKEVDKFIEYMAKNGIQCGYHYPGTGWKGVSLPIYPLLKDKEVRYIINKILEWRKNEND